MEGLVAYRQPYDAQTGEYVASEVFWEEDFTTSALCAACQTDVIELFKKFDVLTFFTPAWKER